ncbi:MAG: hypothetical protein LBE35_01165 [Clostridiales bacterium]|jgi:outer membrane lipoprotein-sorting protein|nr:hypothetical protein [Clostridiales bacterium]
MKRIIQMFTIGAALLILAACGAIQERVDAGVYERIHRQLLNMESFMAQATVTYISNHNTHVYETLQHARVSGEYRIEVTGPISVAGNITIFDGNTISQFNPRLDGRIAQTTAESPERLEILLTSFVRNFIRAQEVTVVAATLDEALTTVLEAPIPGEHPYLATSRLWVDNETLKPIQLTIYDSSGTERVIVAYNAFEFDAEMDDGLFRAEMHETLDFED